MTISPEAVPAWSQAARERLLGDAASAAQAVALRQQLLSDAESALADGEVQVAQDLLDRAALMRHAADTEAALVRTAMQAGQYRRALAFGAHAAGAHRRELPAGQALYAWLLQVGGQGLVAQRLLADARAAAPEDSVLRQAQATLHQPWPLASGRLLQVPLRTAPVAVQSLPALPDGLRVAGTGVLLGGGYHAVMPLRLLQSQPAVQTGRETGVPASTLWVRNGLGQARAVLAVAHDPVLGVAVLRLAQALLDPELTRAARPPFAGSPGSVVAYATDDRGEPAWPLLHQGFFARELPGAPRPLGLDAPSGAHGGPVFNQAGQLVGLALRGDGAADIDLLLPIAHLAERHASLMPPPAPPEAAPRVEIDAIYERALRATVQLLIHR